MLLEQKRGSRPKQWRDGKVVAWSTVIYYNIALEMDTRRFVEGQVLKVAAVGAGVYEDDDRPAGKEKIKKYQVTAIH